MARKPKLQARISHDLEASIENYADEREDQTKPEAVRELLRAGLARKGYPVATDGGAYMDDVRADVRRASTGTTVAVAYLAVAVLAPSTFPVSVALSAVGVLLAVGLWYAGMFDLSALRGGSDE